MTEFATTDGPIPPIEGVAQFYVTPWLLLRMPFDGRDFATVVCKYADRDMKPVKGNKMAQPDPFFRLTQLAEDPAAAGADVDVRNLQLLSATAKTLEETCHLGTTFLASVDAKGNRSVIVPVLPGTTRGVILVFRSPATGDTQEFLVATSDPEIKNGSNNSDD